MEHSGVTSAVLYYVQTKFQTCFFSGNRVYVVNQRNTDPVVSASSDATNVNTRFAFGAKRQPTKNGSVRMLVRRVKKIRSCDSYVSVRPKYGCAAVCVYLYLFVGMQISVDRRRSSLVSRIRKLEISRMYRRFAPAPNVVIWYLTSTNANTCSAQRAV